MGRSKQKKKLEDDFIIELNNFFDNDDYGDFTEKLMDKEKEILQRIENFDVFLDKRFDEMPLKFMFKSASYELIELVLNKVSKIPQSQSLLEYGMAASSGNDRPSKIISLAKKCGYKINSKNSTYLLHCLIECSFNESLIESKKSFISALNLLISYKAEINSIRPSCYLPLELAYIYGNVSLVKILLTHGADVNFVDKKGVSPLLTACGKPPGGGMSFPEFEGRLDVLSELLEAGADPYYKIGKVQTPLYWAKRTNRDKTIELLSNYVDLTEKPKEIKVNDVKSSRKLTWEVAQNITSIWETFRSDLYDDSKEKELWLKEYKKGSLVPFLKDLSAIIQLTELVYVWWYCDAPYYDYAIPILCFSKNKTRNNKGGYLIVFNGRREGTYKFSFYIKHKLLENKRITPETPSCMIDCFNYFNNKYFSV